MKLTVLPPPLPLKIEPWGGSEAKVCFTMRPYFMPDSGTGITCDIESVMIFKLVKKGEKSADVDGWDEDGEGLDLSDYDTADEDAQDIDDADDEDDDDADDDGDDDY